MRPGSPSSEIRYHLGVDGISLLLILLTTLLTPIAIFLLVPLIDERVRGLLRSSCSCSRPG